MSLRRISALLLVCFAILVPVARAASPNIVISQAYGGGGATTGSPAYINDYAELFNTSNAAVSIAGWSLQYGSSTGNFGNTGNVFTFPAGTSIPAGGYLTVKLGAAGTLGANFTADFTSGGLSMAAASGKVALVNSGTALGCGATATPCTLPDVRIVDSVAWGASNNGEGGTTVNNGSALNSTNGAVRKSSGCQDTDNNNNDFVVATTGTGLVPRTASSPTHSCVVANNPPTITAPANPIAVVFQNAAPFTVSLSGTDDGGVYSWSATAGTGISSVTVTGGQGTANVTYTVTLQSGFTGTATFTAFLSDTVNPAATQAVNIQVNPIVVNNPPAIVPPANPIATVAQDAAPFTVGLSGSDDNNVFTWSATTGTGVSAASVTAGQGTANVTYTVTLQTGFSGTATFTARLSDGFNAVVTQAVNITVTPAPPPPLDHIVISQVYGGGGNSGATYQNDYVELYNPTLTAFNIAGWSIQYASATGTSWQVQPLGGVINPGEYYLISLASGGAVGALLPTPNIDGEINMSGTTGKVALSSNGDAFSNCPVGDPFLVDLVGYGTANCHEGATNAPAPSNTTSDFRKNGGFTDTNVNGSDFLTGVPNPRRTAPIVEIGPAVLSTDPRNAGVNAPRDANITVTFTEPVTVDPGWFGITCASTGAHNDGTVGAGGANVWIIVPNVPFINGETCTVTIFKDFVHDVDLDDSAPNSDTLPANYTFSFLTSTGTAPPYPPDVHLTMGNPSGAVADTLVPNNYLMSKPELALSYNRDRGTPNWVSWHLTDEWIGTLSRFDSFRADSAVPPDWYRVLGTDYSLSGFDRGHMTPNADRDKETSIPINQATFLMSNMVPQAPDNNQGPWANLENFLRTLLPANELYIVSGPAGIGGTGSNGFATTIANGHVTVPAYTWKVVLVLPKASGDDVARVTAATQTIAVILPNVQGIRNDDWHIYLVSVDQVEALTGYDFFANVSDAVENAIEAGINGANPPGVANQSTSTNEDVAKTFTLDAASPNANPLTYTILSGPSHGSLAGGTGSSQTYTPVPDFNGTDSFTFRVSDGVRTSNTATMTITILEVNDPPVAANDSKSTNEDTALQFAAAGLTSNDSAGPANESGQTLTVTSVTATADTHGSVTLSGGLVTYSPDANFNGSASFSYQVCDNGVTAGLTSPLCTTATVAVSVAPVNDPPVAVNDSKSTDEDTPLSFGALELSANDTAGPADESGQTLTVTSVAATADTHGTVALSGGVVTYTPATNFNGAASFDYQVCDNGSPALCTTATVAIAVAPVNDAPAAANDSKSTNEDTTLQFAASDLTANDSTGPANESGQTLTVASVAATADTHGTVALTGGVVTYVPAANYNGPASFSYQVCDNGAPALCATATVAVAVTPVNDPPTASLSAPSTGVEGSAISASVSGSDVDAGDSLAYSWTVTKNGSPYTSGSGTAIAFTPDDNGSYVVSATVTDLAGATGSDSKTVTVTNVAPSITTVSGPAAALPIGSSATIVVGYTDPGTADTHTAVVTWGDSSSSPVACAAGTCTASHTFAAAGVYGVTIVLSDDDAGSTSAQFDSVVVFDTEAGFVTGGGFLDLPGGKATLNVNAKYVKNQSAPIGNTQFQTSTLDFKSTSYDWLAVAGPHADYQGTGTINGSGAYSFRVSATDAATDTFRIRIWDTTTGTTIYDSGPEQPLGSGSIQIHK